jgi:hypothetical protein
VNGLGIRNGTEYRHARASQRPCPGFHAQKASRTAALIQGQRDFFGAHTYKRTDNDGTFHTVWSGDRTEVEAQDTH